MEFKTFSSAMKQRFGCKVYKLSIDGGFTCPNRDGTLGFSGCTFCSKSGSGEFAEGSCGSILQQLELAKGRVSPKNKDGRYIAYFQSFTNTYAPVAKLEQLFSEAISPDYIAGLSIGTRPDCLEDDKIALLTELNRIKPVQVELGLQTIKDSTARYIRRGYPLSTFDDAMKRLKAAGLETVVHMIIGLPGETAEDMKRTARYISDSGADGIKLQLLHILKDADIYNDYIAGKVQVLEMDEYINILIGCLMELRQDIIIHRLTGDGAKSKLVAPLWSADKKRVLNTIRRELAAHNISCQ